jgi:hypothetical protein
LTADVTGNGSGVRIAFAAAPQVVEQGPGRVSVEWIGINRGSATAPARSVTDVVTVNGRSLRLALSQALPPAASYTSAFPITPLLVLGANRITVVLDADGGHGPAEEREWAVTVELHGDGSISVSP